MENDYTLIGVKKFEKLGDHNREIVYCPYVPVSLPPEEMEKLKKKKRAGWTYATVSLEHPSASVRSKRGKVLETRIASSGEKELCLFIDTINKCSKSGCHTLVGVSERAYEKVCVEAKYITKFETYDVDGNEITVEK